MPEHEPSCHDAPHATFCAHIRPFSDALLDSRASGCLIGWFLRQHLKRCRSCQAALASLIALRARLQALRNVGVLPQTAGLGADRWQDLRTQWKTIGDTLADDVKRE